MKQCVLRGLRMMSSCVTFLCACQIVHIVMHNRIICIRLTKYAMVKSQFLVVGSWVLHLCSRRAPSASAQTERAIVHSMSECLHESSAPHALHVRDG
jgi:hypothetical protein